jgi:hypothetical protein
MLMKCQQDRETTYPRSFNGSNPFSLFLRKDQNSRTNETGTTLGAIVASKEVQFTHTNHQFEPICILLLMNAIWRIIRTFYWIMFV